MATTQQSVIKKFMESLDKTKLKGTAAIDAAVKACSNFNNISEVINKMVGDCIEANDANKFLKNYCGIDLSNADTGAITGKDAGGKKAKTAESVVPEVGSLKTYKKNSFTTNGVTFKLVKFDDNYGYVDTNFNSLTDSQKYIWQALYTWWAPNALNLISSSYGNNFGFDSQSSATTKTIHFGFYENDSATLNWTISYYDDNEQVTDLAMAINMDYYSNLDKTNVNGYDLTSQTTYLDRTLAHELTHAVMMANINNYYDLPATMTEGMAELTHGIDDERAGDILTLATNPSLLQQALRLSPDYNYMQDVWAPDYSGGYMLLRYLAYQTAAGNDSSPSFAGFTKGNDNYTNYTSNKVLSALAGNDTVKNVANNVTVKGDAGKDYLYNSSSNVLSDGGSGNDKLKNYYGDYVTLSGGSGNDSLSNDYGYYLTMSGGAGNDTIINCHGVSDSINGGAGADKISLSSSEGFHTVTGGAGNDTIYGDSLSSYGTTYQYASGDGNDVIYGYQSKDTVTITGGSYTTSTVKNNVLIKVGSGTVTLVGAKGKSINIYPLKGFTKGNDSYTNSTSNTVLSALAGNDTVKNYASNVTIKGDSGKDYLYNEKNYVSSDGGSGNDKLKNYYGDYVTLSGGSGNDSLNNDFGWFATMNGGNGNDTVIVNEVYYNSVNGGAGNDKISLEGSRRNTVIGGKGNDTIYSSDSYGNIYRYASGDGNDVIYGYNANDTINITSGNYKKTTSGKNVVLTVGEGKITLVGAKGMDINIKKGKFSYAAPQNSSVVGNNYIANMEDYADKSEKQTDSVSKNKRINPPPSNNFQNVSSCKLFADDVRNDTQLDSLMMTKADYSVGNVVSPRRYVNLATRQNSLQSVLANSYK